MAEFDAEGEQAAFGQRGTASGQRGTASSLRSVAEDIIALQLGIEESAREAHGATDEEEECSEDDLRSQAASLANSADGSMGLPIVMPKRPPRCFLCHMSADSPSPLCDGLPYRAWANYNKVKRTYRAMARVPTGCVCSICRNVYKSGASAAVMGRYSNTE